MCVRTDQILECPEDNLGELVLLLHRAGSRDLIRHGLQAWGKVPSLSYLASPVYFLKQVSLCSHTVLELAVVNLLQPWDHRHELPYLP